MTSPKMDSVASLVNFGLSFTVLNFAINLNSCLHLF